MNSPIVNPRLYAVVYQFDEAGKALYNEMDKLISGIVVGGHRDKPMNTVWAISSLCPNPESLRNSILGLMRSDTKNFGPKFVDEHTYLMVAEADNASKHLPKKLIPG